MQVEPTVAAPAVAAEVAPVTAEKEKKRKRKSEAAAEGAVEGAEATVGEDGEKKVRLSTHVASFLLDVDSR